jgi:O-antigen/teichoic acid export membrane protein
MKAIRAACELIGIFALFVLVMFYPPLHIVWTVIGGFVAFYALLWIFFKWWEKYITRG